MKSLMYDYSAVIMLSKTDYDAIVFSLMSYLRKKNNKKALAYCKCFFGAPAEIRTPDTLIKSQVLYRLSYRGILFSVLVYYTIVSFFCQGLFAIFLENFYYPGGICIKRIFKGKNTRKGVNYMKKSVLIYVPILLFLTVFLAAMPISGEEALYNDVIRLHILAASDSEEDQRNKLAVRDAVMREYGAAFSACRTRAEAAALAEEYIPAIQALAEETLASQGAKDTVRVTLTEESYDRRYYSRFAMPAGEYLSLRVLIGYAEGKNWWCVLFPPLCTESATGETAYDDDALPVGLTPAEYRLITGDSEAYVVRFKILEILSGVGK